MNSKLISLLIRSNALVIEALKATCNRYEAQATFDRLSVNCIRLAEKAESIENDLEIKQSVVSAITDPDSMNRIVNVLHGNISPMVPISPAHEVKHQSEPLRMQDAATGRVYLGKSSSTGQYYTARIEDIHTKVDINGSACALKTIMLTLADKDLIPFDRFLLESEFIKEFIRWEQ